MYRGLWVCWVLRRVLPLESPQPQWRPELIRHGKLESSNSERSSQKTREEAVDARGPKKGTAAYEGVRMSEEKYLARDLVPFSLGKDPKHDHICEKTKGHSGKHRCSALTASVPRGKGPNLDGTASVEAWSLLSPNRTCPRAAPKVHQ